MGDEGQRKALPALFLWATVAAASLDADTHFHSAGRGAAHLWRQRADTLGLSSQRILRAGEGETISYSGHALANDEIEGSEQRLLIETGASRSVYGSHDRTASVDMPEPVQKGLDKMQEGWESMLKAMQDSFSTPSEPEPSYGSRYGSSASDPEHQGEYFRPVSTTVQCTMALTILCLTIYTGRTLSSNSDELAGMFKPTLLTQTLSVASRVTVLPPMMCMLFVGCRMYVLATTQGLGEPPQWVKKCMYASSGGIVLQIFLILFLAKVTDLPEEPDEGSDTKRTPRLPVGESTAGEPSAEDDEQPGLAQLVGEDNDVHPLLNTFDFKEELSCVKRLFWMLQLISILLIYGGVAGVVYGIKTYPAQTTKISPAVICTVLLTILFMFTYFLLWFASILPDSVGRPCLRRGALAMSTIVRRAPMFAVVFLASRMRALQLDPPYGMPPEWMQQCFFGITAAMYFEVVLGFLIGAVGTLRSAEYGVYLFRSDWRILHFFQHTAALAASAAIVPLIYGVMEMEDKTSGTASPLSTTVRMTLILGGIYFGVQFLQSFTFFLEDMANTVYTTWQQTFIRAGVSVSFAPLLAILFVATRMRALQITQQKGAPPGWAQDFMIIAVFATCVQAMCCVLMPMFIGAPCKVDEDGNPDYDVKPMIGAYAVQVVKYVALICIHGSVAAICVAVFTMTPETAKGEPLRRIQGAKAIMELMVLTCVIILIALLLSSAKVIGMAVKLAIESVDRPILGTDVEIKCCALNLCRGYVNIKDAVVRQPLEEVLYEVDPETGSSSAHHTGRPLEWREDFVLKVHLALVKINLWRLFTSYGKEFEITNISLTGIHANIEKPTADMHKHDSNLDKIIQHIEHLGLPKLNLPEIKLGMPRVYLHKLALGDIGCSVSVNHVPMVGQIRFSPNIGIMKFDDVQHDVFHDRDDITGNEAVAMIIKAVFGGIKHVMKDSIPSQIMKMTRAAGTAVVGKSASTVRSLGHILRERACPSRKS